MKPTLEELIRYQEAFVKPMVEAVRQEMLLHITPLADGQQRITDHLVDLDKKVASVERNQFKALIGWSAYATLIGVAMAAAWRWFATKLHWA